MTEQRLIDEAVDNAMGKLRPVVDTLCHEIRAEFPQSHREGYPCIPYGSADALTTLILAIIAELVVEYIDAGSEREATMENERLYNAIRDELVGWSENEEAANKAAHNTDAEDLEKIAYLVDNAWAYDGPRKVRKIIERRQNRD